MLAPEIFYPINLGKLFLYSTKEIKNTSNLLDKSRIII
jgi:hypothetical protein